LIVMTTSTYKSLLGGLTAQEQQILDMLLQGMNTSEISKRMSLSYQSVAEMNSLIQIKLNVKSVNELRQAAE